MSLKAIISYQGTTKEIAMLKENEEHKMLDPIIGSGKRQFTLESYISIFSKHDIHHLEQIRNKLSH